MTKVPYVDDSNTEFDCSCGYNISLGKYFLKLKNETVEAKGYFTEDQFRNFATDMINLIENVRRRENPKKYLVGNI